MKIKSDKITYVFFFCFLTKWGWTVHSGPLFIYLFFSFPMDTIVLLHKPKPISHVPPNGASYVLTARPCRHLLDGFFRFLESTLDACCQCVLWGGMWHLPVEKIGGKKKGIGQSKREQREGEEKDANEAANTVWIDEERREMSKE